MSIVIETGLGAVIEKRRRNEPLLTENSRKDTGIMIRTGGGRGGRRRTVQRGRERREEIVLRKVKVRNMLIEKWRRIEARNCAGTEVRWDISAQISIRTKARKRLETAAGIIDKESGAGKKTESAAGTGIVAGAGIGTAAGTGIETVAGTRTGTAAGTDIETGAVTRTERAAGINIRTGAILKIEVEAGIDQETQKDQNRVVVVKKQRIIHRFIDEPNSKPIYFSTTVEYNCTSSHNNHSDYHRNVHNSP